jgi:hypothetical protein
MPSENISTGYCYLPLYMKIWMADQAFTSATAHEIP